MSGLVKMRAQSAPDTLISQYHLCETVGCNEPAPRRAYCLRCEEEMGALHYWAREAAADERRANFEEWRRRFFLVLLLALALEGAVNFAFDLLTWTLLLIELGWAVLMAAALATWWRR